MKSSKWSRQYSQQRRTDKSQTWLKQAKQFILEKQHFECAKVTKAWTFVQEVKTILDKLSERLTTNVASKSETKGSEREIF